MNVFTDTGVDVLNVRDEDERSTVGQHWNAIQGFLGNGDVRLLDPFQGETVAGRQLQADASETEEAAHSGEIDFEHIYRS